MSSRSKRKGASVFKRAFSQTIILSLALIFGFAHQSLAADRYVDDDGTYNQAAGTCDGTDTCYSTIQSAINGSSSGDNVIVCYGTYNENITMADGVDVGNYGTDTPVIDSDGVHAAVTFNGAFSTGATLDGLGITDGGNNGGVYVVGTGTGTGIGNSTIIQYCEIYSNSGPGINLNGGSALSAPTIDNNDIHNNSGEGIYIIDAGSSSVDLIIKNNDIYNHNTAGQDGINIGGDSYVTIGADNNIYYNDAGIAFDTGDPNTAPVTISKNHIYSNDGGGICQVDALTGKVTITQNDIELNGLGGIGIHDACEMEITENELHDNVRGGIHTGDDTANGGGFTGSMGSADLTITHNKVYNNGESSYGGGIDVRHASGIISYNLAYENHRGGIRFGWENAGDDHITDIENNTVVSNGQSGLGGGIIYDDLAGDVNALASGTPPGKLNIRNNICTHNAKAGLRACFTNTLGSEERDYNLAYSNNGTGATDCGYPDTLVRSCINRNFGSCGAYWNPSPPPWLLMDGPNNIIGDPLFTNMGADDYTLQSLSPAKAAGDDGNDMGAYGGSDPISW